MCIELTGRVALVTGASRGIGLAVARRLADAGATVVINARQLDEGLLEGWPQDVRERIVLEAGDVSDPEVARRIVRGLFSRFKRLDILVNNAGIMRAAMIGMIPEIGRAHV